MRMAKLSRLAGGRAPEGRRGSHAYENNTGHIHGQHKRVGKRGEVTLVHGKPLRPCGPPPLQGGRVFLRTDKRRKAMRLSPNEYSSFVKSPSLGTVPIQPAPIQERSGKFREDTKKLDPEKESSLHVGKRRLERPTPTSRT